MVRARPWFFDDAGYRGQRDTDQQQHCGHAGHSMFLRLDVHRPTYLECGARPAAMRPLAITCRLPRLSRRGAKLACAALECGRRLGVRLQSGFDQLADGPGLTPYPTRELEIFGIMAQTHQAMESST
jgi:hypothetical protein